MRLKNFILSLTMIGAIAILTACNGNKQEQQTNEEVSVQEELSNPIADQIDLLEAECNAIVNQMNQKANSWIYDHPDITDDAVQNDSLNAMTVKERARVREIMHQIDSLKNL